MMCKTEVGAKVGRKTKRLEISNGNFICRKSQEARVNGNRVFNKGK